MRSCLSDLFIIFLEQLIQRCTFCTDFRQRQCCFVNRSDATSSWETQKDDNLIVMMLLLKMVFKE